MTTSERLEEILVRQYDLKREDLGAGTTLEGLGLDSMSVIDLLFTIEDEFQVTIPRDQVELKSLADVVAYIDRLVAEQHALPGPPPPPP